MKHLTLNQSWKLCLAMWKWIAEEFEKDGGSVPSLKMKWLHEHGYGGEEIFLDCFFCEYYSQQCGGHSCNYCPGKLVNKRFGCCNSSYHYSRKPVKFYKKLFELNKKRKIK